ncbi:MAG: hypothetical protein HW380_2344, partial [Magnetococcales bacterium]|nr:hypothetical protein [Magnetococcales bacterium]
DTAPVLYSTDHPPRRRFGGGASKVLVLNLILTFILILLPPKGGLGAQPQGFDFVSLPEGPHVWVHRKLLLGIGRLLPGPIRYTLKHSWWQIFVPIPP